VSAHEARAKSVIDTKAVNTDDTTPFIVINQRLIVKKWSKKRVNSLLTAPKLMTPEKRFCRFF
jgi:hypothetical protein